jgi:hypothetical protein
MPENMAIVSRNKGVPEVEIRPGELHTVGYRFRLFDPPGHVTIPVGDPGFISDDEADQRSLEKQAAELNGWALKWNVDIGTIQPPGNSEPYRVKIRILQDGQPVEMREGDTVVDEITRAPNQGTFTTALSYADFLRLRVI